MGSFTDYGYDLVRHDVTSFGAIIIERNSPASSMMGYTSGTFTMIRNTDKGKNLFRHTPSAKLERALIRSSNGILDEAGTSNAVLGAKGVSVALIHTQVRLAGTVLDEQSGRLFYVVSDNKDAMEMDRLRQLGRVNQAFAVAPLKFANVLSRFQSGEPLPNQAKYARDTTRDPQWYHAPFVNPDQFLNLMAPGSGFATLLRDETGHWWHRPIAFDTIYRSRDRSSGSMEDTRPIVRVEVAVVHSRLGGPCIIKPNSLEKLDYVLTRKRPSDLQRGGHPGDEEIKAKDVMDVAFLSSKQCSPFKNFFKPGKV
jgi:hypothetical protein